MEQRTAKLLIALLVLVGVAGWTDVAMAASCSLTASTTTAQYSEAVTFTAKAKGYGGTAIRLYEVGTGKWIHVKTFTTNAPNNFSRTHTISNLTKSGSYRLAVAEPTNSGVRLCTQTVKISVVPPPAAPPANTACTPVPLSSSTAQLLGVDPWYQKYCRENGILILSSNETPDAALVEAGRVMRSMIGTRTDIWAVLRTKGMKMAIVADTEKILDIPEYRLLPVMFPNNDYSYPRGLGATNYIRVTSSSEENLLCYPNDPYREESITVHEFAHSVMNMGLSAIDSTFVPRLTSAYQDAVATGKWANTYALVNIDEYWAEGVQSYFETNVERDPSDGFHNHVNTRAELAVHDPSLYAIIDQAFVGNTWKYQCPASIASPTTRR